MLQMIVQQLLAVQAQWALVLLHTTVGADVNSCSLPEADGEGTPGLGHGSVGLLSADFYVGSYQDGHGLEQQLGLAGSRLGSAEEALEEVGAAAGGQQEHAGGGDGAGGGRDGGDGDVDDGVLMLLDDPGYDAAASTARRLSAGSDSQQHGAGDVPAMYSTGAAAGRPVSYAAAGKQVHEAAVGRRAVGGAAAVPVTSREWPSAPLSGSGGSRHDGEAGTDTAGHGWRVNVSAKSAAAAAATRAAAAAAAFNDFDEPTAFFYAT
jgi:hypothetical protein